MIVTYCSDILQYCSEYCKYCSDIIKKHFNKERVMIKEDNEVFNNSTKCWFCENDYVDNDIKVKDHCNITGKYRSSAHRDCNINLKINHKVTVATQKLKSHNSLLNMKELSKFNFKINVIQMD